MVVLLISLIICSITVQRMVDPLKGMCAFAHKFAHGEVDTRVTEYANRDDEIGELAIAFNAMADSLAQAEQKRSEFVANVSHELKTPMTTIAGFADGILDGTIPPEKERESLQVISSETRRLSRLVRHISRSMTMYRASPMVWKRFFVQKAWLWGLPLSPPRRIFPQPQAERYAASPLMICEPTPRC